MARRHMVMADGTARLKVVHCIRVDHHDSRESRGSFSASPVVRFGNEGYLPLQLHYLPLIQGSCSSPIRLQTWLFYPARHRGPVTVQVSLSFSLLVQIIWSKINWLIGSIDLTPWYLTVLQGTAPTSPVRLCMLTLPSRPTHLRDAGLSVTST